MDEQQINQMSRKVYKTRAVVFFFFFAAEQTLLMELQEILHYYIVSFYTFTYSGAPVKY